MSEQRDSRKLLLRQLDENYRRLPIIVGAFPLVAVITAASLWGTVAPRFLIAWCLTLTVLAALGLQATHAYLTTRQVSDLDKWARRRTVGAGLNALVYGGMLATLLYVPGDPTRQAFVTTIIIGTTASALLSSANYFPALRAFQIINTLPLIVRFALEGDQLHLALSFLLCMFLLVSLRLGYRLSSVFQQSMALELQNEELVGELGKARDWLATANENLSQKVALRTQELEAALDDKARSEERLVQAQRMEAVGLLAGTIAHDFNNLLTGMMGFASLAAVKTEPDHPSQMALQEVILGCERAAKLTQHLLTFSRGGITEPQSVDLRRTLQALIPMLRSVLGEGNSLEVELPTAPVFVKGTASALDQLLMNLVVNARDAAGPGAQVRVSLETHEGAPGIPSGEHAYLRVSDNGPGIPADVRNRIFEPFFSTKGDKGTGLGLATCFGVVQRAEGLIEVESTSESGTTFAVYLPQVAAPEEMRDSYIGTAPASSRERRILVVEDQNTVLRFALHTLQEHGYDVQTVKDAESALDLLQDGHERIDLVISDVNLPGMNGFDLYNRLNATLRQPPRFLLMSGFIDRRELPRQIAAAKVPVLAKPFEAQQLLLAAGRALRHTEPAPQRTAGDAACSVSSRP